MLRRFISSTQNEDCSASLMGSKSTRRDRSTDEPDWVSTNLWQTSWGSFSPLSSSILSSIETASPKLLIFQPKLAEGRVYSSHSSRKTGGHFACACVNPLNDNSVGASNLMAGNRKLARKLQSFSLVLWIPYFPTKTIRHDKNRTFSTRVFTCRFFSSRFSWPFNDFQDSTPKSHVPV